MKKFYTFGIEDEAVGFFIIADVRLLRSIFAGFSSSFASFVFCAAGIALATGDFTLAGGGAGVWRTVLVGGVGFAVTVGLGVGGFGGSSKVA